MKAEELYALVRQLYPDESFNALGKRFGCCPDVMGNLRNGKGAGKQVAKWISENHPEHADLYERVLEAVNQRKLESIERSKPKRQKAHLIRGGGCQSFAKRFDFSKLPGHLQAWCGYRRVSR